MKKEKEKKEDKQELVETKKHDVVKEAAQKHFMETSGMGSGEVALVEEIARQEGISPAGITILGGKPYINVTGLDCKMFKFEEKIGKRVRRKMSIAIKRATDKELAAGYLFIIEFEDEPEREKRRESIVLECVKANKTAEEILRIIEEMGLSAPIFKAEGWADIRSVKMSTMHNVSCMNMLAERRASNRCKREVVGCGMTSLDELPFGFESFLERKGNKESLESLEDPAVATSKVIDAQATEESAPVIPDKEKEKTADANAEARAKALEKEKSKEKEKEKEKEKPKGKGKSDEDY